MGDGIKNEKYGDGGMEHGFIKVAAATPQIRVADCAHNAKQIIAMAHNAAAIGAKLIVLPELCVTGYTAGDLFLQRTLLEGALSVAKEIIEKTASLALITVFGMPIEHSGKLFNCAVCAYQGEVLGVVPKCNLPNYGEFYELRHFSEPDQKENSILFLGKEVPFGSGLLFCSRQLPDFCLGIEICEDLWVASPPSLSLATAGATVIVNLSASDETIGKPDYRRQLVTGQSARLLCAYLYAGAGDGESSTDMVFSGHSLIAENGVLLSESVPFQNGIILTEIDVSRLAQERRRMNTFPQQDVSMRKVLFDMPLTETKLTRMVERHPFVPSDEQNRAKRCEMIIAMQSHGLKTRLAHTGSATVVVGVSGGLDSSLALLVCVRAMDTLMRPHSDIVAVTMPCFGTTTRTRTNAELLCEALGVTFRSIDITESVRRHFVDIGHDENDQSITYENAQARERTQVLMDIANQTGGLVIGTGDLSELALGWATYNGDHMSMYSVNVSVPKSLVRHIVRYEADAATDARLKGVLYDILDTPVSPELLPAENGEIAQKTEHIVGPYELHDFFLYYVVRFGFTPTKIARLAEYAYTGSYTRAEVLSWLKLFYQRFFAHQFKRSCMPDGPKIGSVTLSPRSDWRMPSDACATLWLDEVEAMIQAV